MDCFNFSFKINLWYKRY